MSAGHLEPKWTSQKCNPIYIWQDAPATLKYTGNQATRIFLCKRQRRKKGSTVERELFVCKAYRTAGIRETAIGGSKYIYREWKTLSSVEHPNIVRYVDFSYDPNGLQVAKLYMQYCSGGDLSQFECVSGPRLTTLETCQVLHQIAQALLYLHHGIYKYDSELELARRNSSGVEGGSGDWTVILHRDIKPANIFVNHRDERQIDVKLGDFGIAKFEDDGSHTYVGSKAFIPPESRSAADERRTTFKRDIWALGETIKALYQRDAISQNNSQIRAQVERLMSLCLETDDEARPGSAYLVDNLEMYVFSTIEKPMTGMLAAAITKVIEWDTSVRSKEHKRRLAGTVSLCQWLILLGSEPARSALSALFDFILQPQANASCPAWKSSKVEQLVALLEQHFPGTIMEEREKSQAKLQLLRAKALNITTDQSQFSGRKESTGTIASRLSALERKNVQKEQKPRRPRAPTITIDSNTAQSNDSTQDIALTLPNQTYPPSSTVYELAMKAEGPLVRIPRPFGMPLQASTLSSPSFSYVRPAKKPSAIIIRDGNGNVVNFTKSNVATANEEVKSPADGKDSANA